MLRVWERGSGRYHWYMGNHVASNYVDGQFVVVATDTVIAGLRKCTAAIATTMCHAFFKRGTN